MKTRAFRNIAAFGLAALVSAGVGCGEDSSPSPGPDTGKATDSWTGDPVVHTAYGAVRGFEDVVHTWVWKAIPFAKPPVGPLRWRAPREPDPWEGTREATKFSSACPQYFVMGDLIVGNEDCLYLNVWRPESMEKDLPVYFWIHGGGNSIGAGTLSDYYGAHIADASRMVVVTVNYRLGPFGWFTYPALRTGVAGDEKDDSGNYGTLDLIRALEWVRDNIRAFGGDPHNVTIAGESAGALDVFSLLIAPPARDLFHRAVAESGVARSNPLEAGDTSAHGVLVQLLINDGIPPEDAEAHLASMTDAQVEAYLRSKTDQEILRCYEPQYAGMLDAPDIFEDGTVIPDAGFSALETGTYPNKVPIIIGSNKEEKKLFIFGDPFFDGRDDLYQIVATYASDAWKASGVDEVARRLRANPDQPNVYVYQFLWGAWKEPGTSVLPGRVGFKIGSCHTLEIPFFFGNDTVDVVLQLFLFTEENRPGREALSRAIMAYAGQFARTGDPNRPGSGLPEWRSWSNDPGQPKCILFDVDEHQAIDITMSSEELTESGVRARMAAEVPEPLYSEAREYLGW